MLDVAAVGNGAVFLDELLGAAEIVLGLGDGLGDDTNVEGRGGECLAGREQERDGWNDRSSLEQDLHEASFGKLGKIYDISGTLSNLISLASA